MIPQQEEFKWNLSSSKADYANLHFKNYIPDKDIDEKILMENPVSSNLQEVPVLDDFVKTLLVSQTAISTDQQMEKFQENILLGMGPLSRLWEGLEDVRNESSEAVEVPVDTFATVIELTTLLLGQASLSISYTSRLNILKTLLKHPCKAKTLLKEKTALFQKSESHLFGKKFLSHIFKTGRSKKQSLKVFRGSKTLPFKNVLYHTKIDREVEGDTIKRQNHAVETKSKTFDFTTTHMQVPESSIMQVQHQMVNTSFTIQEKVTVTSNPELVPLIKIPTLEHVHPIIRKLFTKSIPNVPLAGRLPDFITAWEKLLRTKKYHLL